MLHGQDTTGLRHSGVRQMQHQEHTRARAKVPHLSVLHSNRRSICPNVISQAKLTERPMEQQPVATRGKQTRKQTCIDPHMGTQMGPHRNSAATPSKCLHKQARPG